MIQKIYKRKFELIYLSHTKKEFLLSFSSLKNVNNFFNTKALKLRAKFIAVNTQNSMSKRT